MTEQPGFGSWLIDQERRRWVTHRKIAGWLDALHGFLGLCALLYVALNSTVPIDWPVVITASAFVGLFGAAGVGLLLQHRWARWLLWPISVLLLPALPFGTLLGGYNLWVLYNTRSQATSPA